MRFAQFRSVFSSTVCAALIVAAAQGVALAHHEGDIALENISGQIVTGHHEGSEFHVHRVFEGLFGNENVQDWTHTPGFDSAAGTWPVPSAIGFNILDALRKWNGTDFSTIPTERISMSNLGDLRTTPTAEELVEGFTRNVVASGETAGSWHEHFDFHLLSPNSDGIYLLQLELFNTNPSIAESDPFYIVFARTANLSNMEELGAILDERELAVAYVETHMVPEPGAITLLASGAGAALFGLWRRRNRPNLV